MTPKHPSAATPQLLSTPRGQVSFIDEGERDTDAMPLLAIHGLPGSVRDYRWLAPCVSPRARIIRLDMPGFAGTPLATAPDPRPIARAEFALAVADALGLSRFAVMGHSMGGPVAMALAASHPDRVAGLALVGSVGQRPHRFLRRNPHMGRLVALLRWVPGAKLALLPLVKRGFVKAGFSPQLSKSECHHSLRCVAATSFGDINRWIEQIQAQATPALVAWAEDDRLIEAAIFQELADALPAGPRHAFPEGGHNIQKTQAIELGESLSHWLSALS